MYSISPTETNLRRPSKRGGARPHVLAHILDKRGLEYEILSDTQANVYGELVVSDVALELAEQNCRMFSVQEYEESLESYYLNLVGGGKHE